MVFTCIFLSFLIGCASTGSPGGGPRDTYPPKLVVEESSKNYSTNFIPEKLELVFDEWIELKNQQKEILISPPFFKNPKITSRGKKVTVEFPEDEPLREDATYTLNFGKSIVDFTEGNAAEGFRFIFATGDKIDSLGFSGRIEDAKDSKPVKDILVLLYDLVEDSVVVFEKPFYYARTDDSGNFKFENLKNDTFKLFVLEDLNFNYLLDAELERLAFPDSLFILNDSTVYNPTLRLFKPEQSLRILNSSSQTPGLVTTVFNREAEEVDFSFLYPDDFDPLVEKSKDTLMFWFTEDRDSVGVIYDNDTLDFTVKPYDTLFYNSTLSMEGYNAAKTILAPFDSLNISFTTPLAAIDTSLIRLTNQPRPKPSEMPVDSLQRGRNSMSRDSMLLDSMQLDSMQLDSMELDSTTLLSDTLLLDSTIIQLDTILSASDSLQIERDSLDMPLDTTSIFVDPGILDSFEIDTLDIEIDSSMIDSLNALADTILIDYEFEQSILLRDLFINSAWEEKSKYRLELLPGAVTDIYGRQNDSLSLDFKTAGLDEFGNIAINLSGLDSAQKYIVLLKLNEEIIKKTLVIDSTTNRIEHTRLRVNTYSIELIKDDNGDGEWTTGDYWKNRQPEELKTFELEKLRENWDLEANVFWNEVKTSAIDSSGAALDSLSNGTPQDSLLNRTPPDGLNQKNERGEKKERERGERRGRNDKGKNEK